MRKWEIQDTQWYAQGIVVMRERKHFWMRSDMAQETVVMRQWMILGCAVNHVLSCHGFAFCLYTSESYKGI